MNVRCPSSILIGGADARKLLSASHMMAGTQAADRVFGEMPVEREEFFAVASFVLKNSERPIVHGGRVIRHDVNDAVERRSHRRSLLHEQVDPKMNGPPLSCGIAACAEERRCIERSSLVVTSHAEVSPGLLYL